MDEMVLSSTGQGDDAKSLLNQFRITDADLELVRKFGKKIKPNLKAYVDEFYVWLEVQPYFDSFFRDKQHIEKTKNLQVEYWHKFFDANVDDEYVESRRYIGKVDRKSVV